mmetsp:Transcript_19220/g.27038  ORF Transcript_19220/g.27038 Transcript_19220/m.27038 type:complete len:184 (-) Transcript_19220:245-796(-)
MKNLEKVNLVYPENTSKMDNTDVEYPIKEFDVTDTGCQICLLLTCPLHWLPIIPGIIGRKSLSLEHEEAIYSVSGGCCDVNTRRPYGELGSVDVINCLCCNGVTSDIFKGYPLFLNDTHKSATIVAELKKRMKERGDTGQIRRTEETLSEVKALKSEVAQLREDMQSIMKHLRVPPSTNSMSR